jgi:tetratricopeptide (TPR) repeat protein
LTWLLLLVTAGAFAQKEKRKKSQGVDADEMRRLEATFIGIETEKNFLEGEKFYMLEDYSKSLAFFQRVLELDPDNASACYKMAEILSKSTKEDDLRRAGTYIDTALKIEKNNKYFYLLGSAIYSGLGNFSRSEELLESMMRVIPGTENYLYELAATYQYDKKPDEAIKVYNRAENLLGINEVSSLQKQRIYLDQGKINEAMEEGQKLLNAYPDEESYAMGFAEALSQKGQVKKAAEIVEQFILSHPQAGSSRILLAGFYRDMGQEDKARTLLRASFQNPDIDISSKVIVISTYNEQIDQSHRKNAADPGAEVFALELLDMLLKTYPEEPNVHTVAGDLYVTLARKREAEQEYSAAIRRGTNRFETWQNLLSLQSEHNEFDSLIHYTESGLEIFPNQALLYYFNGYANIRKKQFRQAITSLEHAKRLSAQNAGFVNEINMLLGDAYNGIKDYSKSDIQSRQRFHT